MFLLVTHAIYIIIVFTVIVQSYIISMLLNPGLSREKVTVHAGVLLSDTTALSSPRSPDVVLGERVLRMLISCPECHRIPLTRSVFMFGTIEDTPSIIRTGCTETFTCMHKVKFPFSNIRCLPETILGWTVYKLIVKLLEELYPVQKRNFNSF